MTSDSNIIGPFFVDQWPRLPANSYGTGYHSDTLEKVTIKSEISGTDLASEACALQMLSGGIGIPNIYWFGTACGRKIMITEMPGDSLEKIYDQGGRYFELQILLEFAHQLIFRLEWMHARYISHGNLNPFSFTLGRSSWQAPQITISDFGNADLSQFSARKDLEAVGDILLYFASANTSWDDFKARKPTMLEIPSFLQRYFSAIRINEQWNPADYAILRSYFYISRQFLKRSLFGGLSDPEKQHLSLRSLYEKTTGDLYDALGTRLSAVGQEAGCVGSPWTPEKAGSIAGALDEIMALFMVLLMRDRPSRTRRRYLMGAFHLPNRLWRDLRWYLCTASRGSISFQSLITLRIYNYVGVLLEIIPVYNRYWTAYLSELAYAQMALDLESSAVWRQAWIYWKDCANYLKKL